MIDLKQLFDEYCQDHQLDIQLCFDIPQGYEDAFGTFDVTQKTLFFNSELLKDFPEEEQCFHLYHELRHALQYLKPEQFDEAILRSLPYVIMYDGTVYKLVDGAWKACRLEGTPEELAEAYKGQPYEVDANTHAYERVRARSGGTRALEDLMALVLPKDGSAINYEEVYRTIDGLIDEGRKERQEQE